MTFRRWSRAATVGAGLFFSRSLPIFGQQTPSYHDLLIALRDTVTSVEAGVWEFNRDLRSSGRETILARASYLRVQCHMARPALSGARKRLLPAAGVAGSGRSAAGLIDAIARLERTFREECGRGFREDGPGSWADSLRAWGPFRGNEIVRAIRSYETAASTFAAAMGITLDPRMPR